MRALACFRTYTNASASQTSFATIYRLSTIHPHHTQSSPDHNATTTSQRALDGTFRLPPCTIPEHQSHPSAIHPTTHSNSPQSPSLHARETTFPAFDFSSPKTRLKPTDHQAHSTAAKDSHIRPRRPPPISTDGLDRRLDAVLCRVIPRAVLGRDGRRADGRDRGRRHRDQARRDRVPA